MDKITLFVMESCPHCKRALRIMDALFAENADYLSLEIEKIDENVHPEIANKYDYYYVPAFYIGDSKQHEGAVNPDIVRRVLDTALEGQPQ